MSNQQHSLVHLVRQMLAVLEGSGIEEARTFSRAFEARQWREVTPEEFEQVARLVARAQAGLLEQRPATQRPEAERTAQPWSPFEPFAAWIDAIPQGREFLQVLRALTATDDADEVEKVLRTLFIEHLRYEAHSFDETARLPSSENLLRLRTIARHAGFTVSLLELRFPYEYATTFQPVFRIHPYGLIVAISPGWDRCRFICPATNDSAGLTQVARSLKGRSRGYETQDNLILWVRRLELLRPRMQDDRTHLLQRAEHAIGASPAEIARNWSSIVLDPAAPPPGISWRDVPRTARAAFLQSESDQARREYWGLERALRSAFPVGFADRGMRLRYDRYVLGVAPSSPDAAFRSGGTWLREVTLHLQIVTGTQRVACTLAGAVPEVTGDGRILLDGIWYSFAPRVCPDGRLIGAEWTTEEEEPSSREAESGPEEDAPEQEEAGPLPEGIAALNPEALSWLDESDDEGERTRGALPLALGTNLCAVLEIAASRLLGAMLKRVRDFEGTPEALARALPSIVSHFARRAEPVLLVSKRFLVANLRPWSDRGQPEDRLRVLRDVRDGTTLTPPAWACVDTSADLPLGRWLPVAGARLDPAGGLAVPRPNAQGRLQLSSAVGSALDVNPRCGAAPAGPAAWWIAPELASFASLPAGTLGSAAHLAARGQALPPLAMLRIPGPNLQARMKTRPPHVPRTRRLVVQIPEPPWTTDARAYLLVSPGTPVRPGMPWLSAAPTSWGHVPAGRLLRAGDRHVEHNRNLLLWAFKKDELPPPDEERWSIPPDVRGRVIEASLEPIRDRAGLRLGWRASIQVALVEEPVPRGHLVLPDGRVAPIVNALYEEDAPFDAEGQAIELLLEDPLLSSEESVGAWRAGATGEPIAGARFERVPLPLRAARGAHSGPRRRCHAALPRPGRRRDPEQPQRTRPRGLGATVVGRPQPVRCRQGGARRERLGGRHAALLPAPDRGTRGSERSATNTAPGGAAPRAPASVDEVALRVGHRGPEAAERIPGLWYGMDDAHRLVVPLRHSPGAGPRLPALRRRGRLWDAGAAAPRLRLAAQPSGAGVAGARAPPMEAPGGGGAPWAHRPGAAAPL